MQCSLRSRPGMRAGESGLQDLERSVIRMTPIVPISVETVSPRVQESWHENAPCVPASLSRIGSQVAVLDDMDTVVVLNQRWLFNFVNRHVRDPDLALDIVQESFMKAYLARARFQHRSSLRTWLASIALNLVRDHKRSEKERFWQSTMENSDVLLGWDVFSSSGIRSAESEVIAKECVGKVAECLKEIPEKYREIIFMRFGHEMSLGEIALLTGTPLNTVKSVLRRVLLQLRFRLYPQGRRDMGPKRGMNAQVRGASPRLPRHPPKALPRWG